MSNVSSQTLLRVGSRGSKLARAQAELVCRALAGRRTETELVTVTTTGDRVKDKPLADIGGKGLFAKELEEALLEGRIDLAVHSMKDLPVDMPPSLRIVATPVREDPADALVSRGGETLETLSEGALLGSSSVRRTAQIARRRPDLRILPLRGNVDTRIAKLERGEFDGIVLALAGLKRLNLQERATAVLYPENWLPALGQGALAVEMREDNVHCQSVSETLDHAPSAIALACERAFQAALGGSCRTPIAGYAWVENNILRFRGEVLAPDGSAWEETSMTVALGADARSDAAGAGRDAGFALRAHAHVRSWLEL